MQQSILLYLPLLTILIVHRLIVSVIGYSNTVVFPIDSLSLSLGYEPRALSVTHLVRLSEAPPTQPFGTCLAWLDCQSTVVRSRTGLAGSIVPHSFYCV